MHRIHRFKRHWQTLPPRNRVGATLCLMTLIAVLIALVFQISGIVADVAAARPAPEQTPGTTHDPASATTLDPASATTLDPAEIRGRVWNKAEPLLEQAGRQAALALNKHLNSIDTFLGERKPGARAFAERLLGLRGKWELVKAEIGGNSDYAAFLNTAFAEHVFKTEDLEKAVEAAVRGYLAELEAIDDELLVRLRADVGDDELSRTVIPALSSEQALRRHYHELSGRVAQDLRTDLALVVGRELFLWQASNIATDLTIKAGAAIAARLGISTTLLSTGAASMWQTLGVGLVVAIVLDVVVDKIIKAAGYDAEEKVAKRVEETLDNLGRTITDGDPDARTTLDKLKVMQRDDPEPEIRTACAEAIQSMEAGTQLYGLRRELTKISAARATVRQETLRRFIHQESEVKP